MKLMKRKVFLVLILLMIPVLAFYGCGGNDDNEDTTDESPAGQETEVTDEEEDEDEVDTEGEEEQDATDEDEIETGYTDLESLFGSMEYPTNFYYEMTMESEEMGSYTTQIWMMDEKMRSEGEWEGQVFITIQDEEHYYTLDPNTMTAMRFPIEENDTMTDEFDDEPRIDEFMVDEDWENITYEGEETLNGVETYVIIDRSDEAEYKMWVHKEYGIPMRMESSGSSLEDDYVMEVRNLQVGEVSDEDFEIPDDYEIMDFGS